MITEVRAMSFADAFHAHVVLDTYESERARQRAEAERNRGRH